MVEPVFYAAAVTSSNPLGPAEPGARVQLAMPL